MPPPPAKPAWTRQLALGAAPPAERLETWECRDSSGKAQTFPVHVRLGKPLDVLGLKGPSLQDVRDYAAFLCKVAADLYAPGRPRRALAGCPCCLRPTADAPVETRVYGVAYHRCAGCGHVFVRDQPGREALAQLFADSERHASAYTDRKALEVRMEQVVRPKVEWVLDTYQRHVGGRPGSGVDVGAGGGHFVEGLRRAGIRAEGYEISKASRAFAQQAFSLELHARDFLEAPPQPVDVVTFWGLLEYTPEPRRFLQAARRWCSPSGLLVLEVPRYDCLGSAVQRAFPETIARHLDPTSHMNLYTDASIATALASAGFRPVAAWYFGMDVYELLVQLALQQNRPQFVQELAPLIGALQPCLDAALASDDLLVAAVPAEPFGA